jgi:hypothetical protein
MRLPDVTFESQEFSEQARGLHKSDDPFVIEWMVGNSTWITGSAGSLPRIA